MLTIEDVVSIPLFAALGRSEIARLADTSADLHLAAGEFAVHEGGERALYAVLSGKIEVVKLYDGVERTSGPSVNLAVFLIGGNGLFLLAERVRFELTSPVKGLRFSRPVQSTALPPLQCNAAGAPIF